MSIKTYGVIKKVAIYPGREFDNAWRVIGLEQGRTHVLRLVPYYGRDRSSNGHHRASSPNGKTTSTS